MCHVDPEGLGRVHISPGARLGLTEEATEAINLAAEPIVVRLQFQDAAHPFQVDSICSEFLDEPQTLQILIGVAAGPAGGAEWLNQALPLVDSERLGVNTGQFGRHRDYVDSVALTHWSHPQVRSWVVVWVLLAELFEQFLSFIGQVLGNRHCDNDQ